MPLTMLDGKVGRRVGAFPRDAEGAGADGAGTLAVGVGLVGDDAVGAEAVGAVGTLALPS